MYKDVLDKREEKLAYLCASSKSKAGDWALQQRKAIASKAVRKPRFRDNAEQPARFTEKRKL